MSDALLASPYGNAHTTYRRGCFAPVVIVGTGATAAAIDAARSGFGFTLLRTGAGAFTVTTPTGVGRGTFYSQLLSPAKTVDGVTVLTYNIATATTTLVVTNAAGTNTDLAVGDELWLLFMLEGG